MPDPKIADNLSEAIRLRRRELRAADGGATPQYSADTRMDLLPYLRVAIDEWMKLALVAAVAGIVTMLVTTFLMRPSYLAMAIVLPTPKSAMVGRLQGFSGGMLGSMGGLAGLMGGGDADDEAQEYMTILKSFDFNVGMIERHQLAPQLLHKEAIPSILVLETRISKMDNVSQANEVVFVRILSEDQQPHILL